MNNEDYISIKKAKEMLHVSTQTLRNWSEEGKVRANRLPSGVRIYNYQDLLSIKGVSGAPASRRKIAYCRVSSKKQLPDLERQKDFFRENYPNHHLVEDIASGINWKRNGLKTILEQSMLGGVSEVVVAHRDRLCRFSFELVEYILSRCNVQLIVLNDPSKASKESELCDDILSIVQVYACRNMGRRRYSKNKPKDKEGEDLSKEESDNEIE